MSTDAKVELYTTLAGEGVDEFEEKRSLFIGHAIHLLLDGKWQLPVCPSPGECASLGPTFLCPLVPWTVHTPLLHLEPQTPLEGRCCILAKSPGI